MARKRGKKALYEVMSKARAKPGFGKTLKQMRQKKSDEKQAEPVKESLPAKKRIPVKKQGLAVDSAADIETSKDAAKFWRKPRVVQFNVGRIEFSMPYQLAIALVLGFILIILAAFRFGQYITGQRATSTTENMQPVKVNKEKPIEQNLADAVEPLTPTEDSILREIEEVKPIESLTPKSTGNNFIVLQEWGAHADLVPVRDHFTEYGIETEIVMKNGRYFLLTKDRYDNNPRTPGTDGYKALQEIIKVGAKYKAPPNHEPFAQHLFSDAYGMKVE